MDNSLSRIKPEIAEEWSEKNLPNTPETVSYGSHARVWWKGKCGHEWQATIHSRTGRKQIGCPYCSGNRVLAGYNDLSSRFPNIAAEWSHKNSPVRPDSISAYSNRKFWWQAKCGHEWMARVADRTSGHGCPYCNDHKLLEGFSDLGTLYPDIALEWSEKNYPATPQQTSANQTGKFWWKCRECGMEYRAWISSRVKGTGCPYCSGKVIAAGVNDLATTDPEVAAEWDYSKNGDIRPTQVHRSSKKLYWWKTEYGYSWQARVSERSIEHIAVRVNGAEYRQILPSLIIGLYASRMGLRVVYNSAALVGITLEITIPEISLAIEMESERKKMTKEQLVKKHICESHGFRYILLHQAKDVHEIACQIISIMRKEHIYIDTDINDDLKTVERKYLELLRLSTRPKPEEKIQ